MSQCGACAEQAVGLLALGVWEGGVEGSCGVEAFDGGGVLARVSQRDACVVQAVGLAAFGSRESGVERVCGVEAFDGSGVLTSLVRLICFPQ